MKKCIAFLIISLLIITVISAQTHKIGIISGLNLSNIYPESKLNNTETKTGFIGGVNYNLNFQKNLNFDFNLLYTQQGFKIEEIYKESEDDLGYIFETNYKYNYLYLPIKAGYRFGNKIKFIPRLGIQPGILLNAKTIFTNPTSKLDQEFDNTDNISKFDFAWNIEVELNTKLNSNLELFTIITRNYSLTNYSNEKYINKINLKHKSTLIGIGFRYELIKK